MSPPTPLLASDVAWFEGKGLTWAFTADGGGGGFLVVSDYPVNGDRYDRSATDLLVRIPAGYPDAGLDMWWVHPVLKLKASETMPQAAEHMEHHIGRQWQRFSRHLNGTSRWKPGLDDLPRYMTLIARELQGG